MSWIWNSGGKSSSEDTLSTPSLEENTEDRLSSLSSSDTSSAYDFTGNSSSFNFDDDDDDDDDVDDYGGASSLSSKNDGDFIDISNLSSLPPTISPRVDFNNLDGINPGAIGLTGYGRGSGGYGGDYGDFHIVRRKGIGEQLTYLGGLSYLSGAAVGGTAGLASALKSSKGKTFKLRLNAVLNGMGKRGALLANSMGVLALLFAVSEHTLFNATREDDALHYAAAGAFAGAVFKSTRGLKIAGLWGLGGAAVGLGAVYASRQGVYGREVQGLL